MPDPDLVPATAPAPLKPTVFHILLALADQESHGYGVIKTVKSQSEGGIQLDTGRFYHHLSGLLRKGWVEESDHRPPDADARRGAYYRLTPLGREVLSAEVGRLARAMSLTRELGLMDEGGVR